MRAEVPVEVAKVIREDHHRLDRQRRASELQSARELASENRRLREMISTGSRMLSERDKILDEKDREIAKLRALIGAHLFQWRPVMPSAAALEATWICVLAPSATVRPFRRLLAIFGSSVMPSASGVLTMPGSIE